MDGYIGVACALTSGALLLLIGFPAARRAIGPKRWYGNRTGRHLLVVGAMLIGSGLVGLGALNDPRQQRMLVAMCIVIMMLGLGYSIVAGYRTSQR